MEKENQRITLSKRLLKEALLRLLTRKQLDQITVSELCGEASINRATFYRHYGTPRDVLKDIEWDCSRELRSTMIKPRTMADIRKVTEHICVYLYDHADLVKILLRCYTDEEVVREINDSAWELREEIEGMPRMDEDTWKLTSACIGFGTYHLIRRWMTEDIPKTPQEVAELVLAITDLRKLYAPESGSIR